MRRIRVIPTLLIDAAGGLVKTVRFRQRTYIADPINAVKIFNEKGADELVLLDIDATREQRGPQFDLLEDIASEAFVPLAYGGGVTDLEQISRLFRLGFEKVIMSTAAHNDPSIVQAAANKFGSQSIVVCVDVQRSFLRRRFHTIECGKTSTGLSAAEAATRAVQAGAGEILVYSIDRDGCYSGYDITLLNEIARVVDVPVVAAGGAKSIDDFRTAVLSANCSAVAAGSMFVYHGAEKGILINYPRENELEKLYAQL